MCQLSGFSQGKSFSQDCFAISINILVNKITKALPKKIININQTSQKSLLYSYCIDYLFKNIEKSN